MSVGEAMPLTNILMFELFFFCVSFSLDFRITKDHGHFNHWKYSAVYVEQLSHWPYWINENEADFVVRKLDANERGEYSVASEHRTCFLGGLYCCKWRMAKHT